MKRLNQTNPSCNNLVTFNKVRFLQALKYLAHKYERRGSLNKFLIKNKLKYFYTSYLVSDNRVPTLKTLVKICTKLNLNPKSFVFNNDPFNPSKDLRIRKGLKLRETDIKSPSDFDLGVMHAYKYLLKHNKTNIVPILHFINENQSVITFTFSKNGYSLLIYLFNKNNKVYALHNLDFVNISTLNKLFNNYVKVDIKLLNTYVNMVYINNLSIKDL